ncbi:MAG: VWA domain-containing protein [Myxococcales bacterium]|jgi:Ca-activated chloride channel family protein|nr:VWA domain-containing protein [Myxococcales bacterium]
MDETFLFQNKAALLLIPLAWAFLLFLARQEKRRSGVIRLTNFDAFRDAPKGLAQLTGVPTFLRLAAVTLVIVCVARPQMVGQQTRDVSVEGIDIVVALDISTSMLAADFKPRDRITVAKQVLQKFIEGRPNDRIGLVVFAGEAYTQAPLTFDHNVLSDILGNIKTGLIEDGTAIGNALATALNRLRESEAKSRVVILITDGDNNAGNISPMEAAAMSKELGIRVFTIVVGKGGKVPYPSGPDFFGKMSYQEVEIPVNVELLKAIADEANGTFYRALDKRALEKGLNDILNQLERTEIEEGGGYQQRTELFPPLLWLAVILLALELLLATTRLRSFP